MAGGKKKKKPAANPARGFATTSIASKPKAEAIEVESLLANPKEDQEAIDQQDAQDSKPKSSAEALEAAKNDLSPEEFEKQLEDQELQLLVEKHSVKCKREALRQKTRLETDRRVLRSQAEVLSTRKWLPAELMEEILDLIKTEGRYAGQTTDTSNSQKQASEEDLTIRLWTLHQALVGAGFLEEKVLLALRHVLDVSDKIVAGNKDAIWGMEESLDWLCRECSREELPDYNNGQTKNGLISRSQAGRLFSDTNIMHELIRKETPFDSPIPSGTNTPRFESDTRHMDSSIAIPPPEKERSPVKKVKAVEYDSDIDPDDLLPVYLQCKTKLFELQPAGHRQGRNNRSRIAKADPESAKLLRKIKKIEEDVLFDRYLAEKEWESKRIVLEREASARRNAAELSQDSAESQPPTPSDSDDEVMKEAAKIGAAMLEEDGSDDDALLADLFASLPVNEVDPITGKSSTVVNGKDGSKVTIRDFGKWTGVSPTRVLEEACKAR